MKQKSTHMMKWTSIWFATISSHMQILWARIKMHIKHGKFSKNQNDGIERTFMVSSGCSCDLSPKKDVLETII